MRISATQLEAYRYWRDNQSWKPIKELEDGLMGLSVENNHMRRGISLAAVLEDPERWRMPENPLVLEYRSDDDDGRESGWTREFVAIDILRLNDAIGAQVPEVPGQLKIGAHEIRCRADGITGLVVHEVKCPAKPDFDPRNYQASFQWRIYMLAFHADVVRYHLVTLDHGRKADDAIQVAEHQTFDFYRYDAMEQDVRNLVDEFEGFVWHRNLESYFS